MQASRKRVKTGLVVGLNTAALQPEEVSAVESYEEIMTELRGLDTKLADKLSIFTTFIGELSDALHNQKQLPIPTRAATSFKSVEEAARAVGVTYNDNDLNHAWDLCQTEFVSDGELSPSAGKFFFFKNF